MDEKKIFLAYIYRALTLLYRYLYKVRADYVFDNFYAHNLEEECGCIDYIPSPESRLAFHYRIAKELEQRYSKEKIDMYLDKCIISLLDNTLPELGEAMVAGLIRLNVDKYNPIFSPLLARIK